MFKVKEGQKGEKNSSGNNEPENLCYVRELEVCKTRETKRLNDEEVPT